ncbi:YpzG family protein [Camelliibacillus cellulosilyticus]|uniref:YpzG family protein n=1 Tax=Camelliibacillus cellulosilyticus TaxID=2174486 RepID=A0ABV9GR63_9BACL
MDHKKMFAKSESFNYTDPFQSPRANPKHSFHQVNGETAANLHNQIMKVQTKKFGSV